MKREIEFKPGRYFAARFLPGKDLHDAITDFCKEKGIKAGYIPVLMGGLKNVDLINPDPNGTEYEADPMVKRYEGIMEYSGQGTIAINNQTGEYENHLHVMAGGNSHDLVCMGHFVKGEIAILTEVVIVEALEAQFVRDFDEGVFPKPLLFFK